jgi:adenylate cyclase
MRIQKKDFRKKLALSAAAALSVLLLLIAEQFFRIGMVERLELISLDFRHQIRGARITPSLATNVVIVEIGEESFESLPDKWPWPRSYYARLIRNLTKAGARVIGIDIIFVGKDSYRAENDEELRAMIREAGNVVLAGRLDIDNKSYRVIRQTEDYGNEFFSVDSSLGFVNVLKDPDEVVRRYVPSAGYLPSFGFAILNRYFDFPPLTTPYRSGEGFQIGGITIPPYDYYSLLINYYGPSRSFRHVDFADVIDDETFLTVEEERNGEPINAFSDPDFGYLYDGTFANKIVLVGSTLPEDQDIHQVPIARGLYTGDNTMYGVEIHANLLESVLRGDFLERQSVLAEILTVFVLTFLTFFATSALKESKTRHHALVELNGFLFTVAELALIGFAAIRLFLDANYVIPVVGPVMAVIGGYFASTAYHFVAERRERTLIKAMFSTYVSPPIVEELVANPEKLKLGGERRELSVLFSDLEGFTTLAETRPPEELVALLNEYLTSMTEIVLRNQGTLDKFEGDLIMAFWGAPVPSHLHARNACTAALQMQAKLASIRLEWGLKKRPLLNARIGINTGEMVVGNMGSTAKFNYTVIGDSVNLASRLEGANKSYRTGIIISEWTHQQVKEDFLCRELDIVSVKGRSEPVTIVELRGFRGSKTEESELKLIGYFEAGLRSYREQRWDEATDFFEKALSVSPGDYPSELQLERIRRYRDSPPGKGWKGISMG